ncbi:hypothetical protein L3V83_14520 [Thiotrichales bacterium 19X7-9]|nr:hypothetical protein [Thiotrichales bacterium 19X7-9]
MGTSKSNQIKNKIDWNQFKVNNPNYNSAFEQLTYFLFCRKYEVISGIHRYKNQAGIETDPVNYKNEMIGFQTKWFDSRINYNLLQESINKAKQKNPELTKIVFYINQELSESSKSNKKKTTQFNNVEKTAKDNDIELEWVLQSNFESILNKPENYDLVQLYFNPSDEIGFIKKCINPDYQTLLNAKFYLEFTLNKIGNDDSLNIQEVLNGKEKIIIISGSPGAGKSILMYKFFSILSGYEESNLDERYAKLLANMPMIINLKDCAFNNLEDLIRDRQKDYKLRNSNHKFTYLLDGLDELSTEKVDHVLSHIHTLEADNHTKKIIISCRSGNSNKAKIRRYFSEINEYKISYLTINEIKKYFTLRNNNKLNLLEEIEKNNQNLLSEIRDVLLIEVLWELIENINEGTTVIDLFELKIEQLFDNPNLSKNIEELNLLNPKKRQILDINKQISFEFQNKSQFRLPQKDIQKIIMDKYPRIDYKSVNSILDYIANCFFDSPYSHHNINHHSEEFIYHHRRYQDFFFIKYLADEYEKSPEILRKTYVLSNKDFFENLFLKYMRSNYIRSRDILGIIELNLINIYLRDHNSFAMNKPNYMCSDVFITSLAIQNEAVFQELLTDENLDIQDKIFFDINEIKNKFSSWKENPDDSQIIDDLIDLYSNGVSSLIENISIFWKFGKREFAKELIKQFKDITTLVNDYKFLESINKDHHEKRNPYWDSWEKYLYIQIVIKDEKPIDILKNLVRKSYGNIDENHYAMNYQESNKEKLIKSYFRVCLDKDLAIVIQLLPELDEIELLMLLEVLVLNKHKSIFSYLPLLFNVNKFTETLKDQIKEITVDNISLLFCKAIYNKTLTNDQQNYLEEELKRINNNRPHEWGSYKLYAEYSVILYTLNTSNISLFGEYLKECEHRFNYYTQINLYAALFVDMISMLKGDTKIEKIIRNYHDFMKLYGHNSNFHSYLTSEISKIIGQIFAFSDENSKNLLYIKQSVLNGKDEFDLFNFSLSLYSSNNDLFTDIINLDELEFFESELSCEEDFLSTTNHYFHLATLCSKMNGQKSIYYIRKGVNNTILRHGWRRDHLVSHSLVEALEVLWKKNWLPRNEIISYSRKVFRLALRVTEITDGKDTWNGPYNVIDLVSQYDIDLTIELKNEFKEKSNYALNNRAISSILTGMITRGFSFKDINEMINEYRKDYYSATEFDVDYYRYKFITYIMIAKSDFYTDNEKEDAFNEAYNQILKIKSSRFNTFLTNTENRDSKDFFIKLCRKYDKDEIISIANDDSFTQQPQITEEQFVNTISDAKTESDINSLYEQLNNYHNAIVLSQSDSWKLLLDKTYEINNNIRAFISFLENSSFPQSTYYYSSPNFKYLHFGLGYGLQNISMAEEIEASLLHRDTGYGGFINIIKSYECINNHEMILSLFKRYLRFCEFLVY